VEGTEKERQKVGEKERGKMPFTAKIPPVYIQQHIQTQNKNIIILKQFLDALLHHLFLNLIQ
jgi:hypothetical protein